MSKLTVTFAGTTPVTKTRNAWMKELLSHVIESCQDDGAYCDNTVNDFYLYGFKGIENMTDDELLGEIEATLAYKYTPVEQ